MRNGRELYRIRRGDLDWGNRVIFVPDSKTVDGRRMIPMSDRAYERTKSSGPEPQVGRRDGYFLPLDRGAVICRTWESNSESRRKAQLSEDLVLHCARYDYGTTVLSGTGNLAAVMMIMALYQHPDLEIVRVALNRTNGSSLQTTR